MASLHPDTRSSAREDARIGRLDRIAIGLSSLCLIHCIATVLLTAVLALGRRRARQSGMA